MIMTQAAAPQPTLATDDNPDTSSITRISRDEMKKRHLTLGEIIVHRYHGSKKPKMPHSCTLRVVPSLAVLAATLSIDADQKT